MIFLFDLSEVLLNGLFGTEHRLKDILRLPAEHIHRGFHVAELNEFFEGRITEDQYWESVILKNDWNVDIGTLKKLVRENFEEIPGTREIIMALKQQGYKIGLLSVHAKEWVDYLEEKFNYHHLFDIVSYSYSAGVSKPHPDSFNNILNQLNAKPGDCVFIDDSSRNIEAAKKLGMEAILFQNPGQLRSELSEYLG